MEQPELRIEDQHIKAIIDDLLDLVVYFRYDSLREYWNSDRLSRISDTAAECHGRGKAMKFAADTLYSHLVKYIPDDQHDEVKRYIEIESRRQYEESLKRQL